MSEKYVLVSSNRAEFSAPAIGSNEVRLTALGKRKNYIAYAITKLTGAHYDDHLHTATSASASTSASTSALSTPQPDRTIVIRAMGRAMDKAVAVAEVVKRRVAGLHQITKLSQTEVKEVYEPTEEGLKTVTVSKYMSSISITLSKDELDQSDPGYQPPIPESEVTPQRVGGPASTQRVQAIKQKRMRQLTHHYSANTSPSAAANSVTAADDVTSASAASSTDAQSTQQAAATRSRGGHRGGRGRGRGVHPSKHTQTATDNPSSSASQHHAKRGRGNGRGRGRGRGRGVQTPAHNASQQ